VAFISERLDVGAATMSLWQHWFCEIVNVMRQRGPVRPKELTPANEKDIVLDETAKPITSAQEIAGNF
jgi:hypothetical protein